MAEIATADIQTHFPVSEIPEAQIDFALAKAAVEIKARIGTDAYADAVASSPEDETASALVLEAVELLTVARLMRNTGLRFRLNGFVTKETDAGSPALGGGSQITNEYLKPQEQIAFAESYRRQAFDNLALARVPNTAGLWTIANASNTETSDSVRRRTSSEYNTPDSDV